MLHDRIEVHKEEIKIAKGIGCFVKSMFEIPHKAKQTLPLDSVPEHKQKCEATNSEIPNKGEGFCVYNYQRMKIIMQLKFL